MGKELRTVQFYLSFSHSKSPPIPEKVQFIPNAWAHMLRGSFARLMTSHRVPVTVLEQSSLCLALAVPWLLSQGLAQAAQNTTAGKKCPRRKDGFINVSPRSVDRECRTGYFPLLAESENSNIMCQAPGL